VARHDLPHNVVVVGIVVLGDQQPVCVGPQVHACLLIAQRVIDGGEGAGGGVLPELVVHWMVDTAESKSTGQQEKHG